MVIQSLPLLTDTESKPNGSTSLTLIGVPNAIGSEVGATVTSRVYVTVSPTLKLEPDAVLLIERFGGSRAFLAAGSFFERDVLDPC
ncbi:hypothetical protein KDA_18540 [Dictyobacter alpinus]|uniref:Uncharacterized protein n=1 Tax=Dictyobacter alpinus TaxID=2014873 RepID=A0A402B4V6_9CHLR|nr:hypothetical protein KDA_18540 [Dictyobacter alpinus]